MGIFMVNFDTFMGLGSAGGGAKRGAAPHILSEGAKVHFATNFFRFNPVAQTSWQVLQKIAIFSDFAQACRKSPIIGYIS